MPVASSIHSSSGHTSNARGEVLKSILPRARESVKRLAIAVGTRMIFYLACLLIGINPSPGFTIELIQPPPGKCLQLHMPRLPISLRSLG